MSARCARGRCAPATAPIRITGQKIFITYGEHDLTERYHPFRALARLSDAPPGTRGISLFLVPEIPAQCRRHTYSARNDVRAHSIEHKLGVHASPTCTMVFGDHALPRASSSAKRMPAWRPCSP